MGPTWLMDGGRDLARSCIACLDPRITQVISGYTQRRSRWRTGDDDDAAAATALEDRDVAQHGGDLTHAEHISYIGITYIGITSPHWDYIGSHFVSIF